MSVESEQVTPEAPVEELPWFHPWTYPAGLMRVVDGDTQDLRLDLGFGLWWVDVRVRLVDTNTAEIHFVSHDSEEYKTGREHMGFTEAFYEDAYLGWEGEWPLVVQTIYDQRGMYGRLLARVYRKFDGLELTWALAEQFGEDVVYE